MRWRPRRSSGVPVTLRVHRLLRKANAARDRRDWDRAGRLYAAALRRDPGLAHIQVQYGHALKEMGRYDEAQAAYGAALALGASPVETELHLGQVAKLSGHMERAAEAYLRAYRHDPTHPDACDELCRIVEHVDGAPRHRLLGILTTEMAIDVFEPGRQEHLGEAGGAGVIVFEITDLLHYFGHARLPTGIQRVQIETIGAALRDAGSDAVRLCIFSAGIEPWLEVPKAPFLALIARSVESDDRAEESWLRELNRLRVMMIVAPPLQFPHDGTLVNLGTSWGFADYFLHVRNAKESFGIRFVPLIYDLVPVITPQFCMVELRNAFAAWIVEMFDHADSFLAISKSTKADLIATAARLDYALDDDAVQVVSLDADFRVQRSSAPGPEVALPDGLTSGSYVLIVATIEPRKNHLLAFRAWGALIAALGQKQMPQLVCVGRRGWMNDAVFAYLAEHPKVRDKVTMLSGIPDATLAQLYAQSLFTLYPSFYEGWGLPVTESLSYGKVPLISDTSSMPEAGGELAIYFRSDDCAALVEKLERLIREPDYRKELERNIADRFRPRSWSEIGRQIVAAVAGFAATSVEGNRPMRPQAEFGRYYPMRRPLPSDLAAGTRSGLGFRIGYGWQPPSAGGCRTKSQGAHLRIGLPAGFGRVRISLGLRGLSPLLGRFMVSGDGADSACGDLVPGRSSVATIEIDRPVSDDPVSLMVCGIAGPEALSVSPDEAVLVEGFVCTNLAIQDQAR